MKRSPSRLRIVAAFCISATSAFLLTQLLHAAEDPPPPKPAPQADAPVDAHPPKAPPARKSKLKKVLPVADFGGY